MNLEKYKQALTELKAGKLSPAHFKGIRVPWGIYSHRGGEVFMTRVRVPAGEVTAPQLIALADAAAEYGNGQLHITTRQDIQIHQIKIGDTIKIMERLEKVGLSPRGGGGNTVRNITACTAAGLCRHEIFDVRPAAVALTEFLLSRESSFNLPRKFKIALAGCKHGWREYLMNDVGLLAAIKDGASGFQVYVGGGMGADSRVGRKLEDFVPAEKIVYAIEAIKNVFSQKGDRKNRQHNRLRFLIDELGFAAFENLYREELKHLSERGQVLALKAVVLASPTTVGNREAAESEWPANRDQDYQEFLKYSIHQQKQKGYSCVDLRIARGDISAKSLKSVAELEKKFSGIEFRTATSQNLLICWVKNEDLFALFKNLRIFLGENFLYAGTLLDIVACKGAQTCNLGICNSPALVGELEKMIKAEFIGQEIFGRLGIRINGCPNACGRHPVGNISFYGLAKRINNRPIPFYKLLLGSRMENGQARLAEEVGQLPARNVPVFLKEFLNVAEKKLQDGNKVSDYLTGEGRADAAGILAKYATVPAYEKDRSFYVDWGRTEEFSLAGISPGECGAGVIDMIESDLKDARQHLAAGDFYQVLFFSTRALLVVKGIEPSADEEVLAKFRESFVEEGIIAYRFKDIAATALSLLKGEIVQEEALVYAKELYTEVAAAYQAMDSNFNFSLREEVKKEAEEASLPEKQIDASERLMDLRGVKCPINYVKVKMKLETMREGERLLLYLDPGEPLQNVPASLKNDGQDIVKIEEKDNYFEVLIIKKV